MTQRTISNSLIIFSFFIISLYTGLFATGADAFAQNTTGTVVETMNGPGYTYMLIDSGTEKTWVAIPETKLETGSTVTYNSGMTMNNFTSKTLNRTFETIVFSSGLSGDNSVPPHGAPADDFLSAVKTEQTSIAPPAPSMDASGGSAGAIVPFQEIAVAKAEAKNGYTVEEIYTQAKKLDGQKIVLRAIVAKVSANIMGKNWVHLQDGTGNPMQNTHDIVATTKENPELNSEITIEGVLAAQKDFGAGYKYDAIIEEAIIKK